MPVPLTQEHTVADSNQPIEFRWLPRQAAPVPRSGHTRAEPSNLRKVRCRPESVTESAANMECNVADLLDRARLLLSQCQVRPNDSRDMIACNERPCSQM